MRLAAVPGALVLLACVLARGGSGFKNDATELLYSHAAKAAAAGGPPALGLGGNSSALNQARHGGRLPAGGATSGLEARNSGLQVGCRELRSTKYISDGQCTSINPLKELVCAGECLPLSMLPNWIGVSFGTKYWSRRNSQDWRCVNDKTRTQRIQLQCQDGSTRTYKITVVTSCKCKRYTRQHNESSHNYESMSPAKPASHHKERKRASKAGKHSLS